MEIHNHYIQKYQWWKGCQHSESEGEGERSSEWTFQSAVAQESLTMGSDRNGHGSKSRPSIGTCIEERSTIHRIQLSESRFENNSRQSIVRKNQDRPSGKQSHSFLN
jgi:hypothetical protein